MSSTNFTGSGYINQRSYTFLGDSQATTTINYLGAAWMANGDGTAPSEAHYFWNGTIAEVVFFNRKLTTDERAMMNHYLSKKWGLSVVVDSDGDGTMDAQDEFPLDATKAFDMPDLSDTVDAQIGEASGLDSVEGDMVLWLDASNINAKQNEGLNNGDAISEWKDLSGNGHHLTGEASRLPEVQLNEQMVNFNPADYLNILNTPTMTFSQSEYVILAVMQADNTSHSDFISTWGTSSGHALLQYYQGRPFLHEWHVGHPTWVVMWAIRYL